MQFEERTRDSALVSQWVPILRWACVFTQGYGIIDVCLQSLSSDVSRSSYSNGIRWHPISLFTRRLLPRLIYPTQIPAIETVFRHLR